MEKFPYEIEEVNLFKEDLTLTDFYVTLCFFENMFVKQTSLSFNYYLLSFGFDLQWTTSIFLICQFNHMCNIQDCH